MLEGQQISPDEFTVDPRSFDTVVETDPKVVSLRNRVTEKEVELRDLKLSPFFIINGDYKRFISEADRSLTQAKIELRIDYAKLTGARRINGGPALNMHSLFCANNLLSTISMNIAEAKKIIEDQNHRLAFPPIW